MLLRKHEAPSGGTLSIKYLLVIAPPPPPHRRYRRITRTVAAIAAGHLPLLISSQLKLTSPLSVRAAMKSLLLSNF